MQYSTAISSIKIYIIRENNTVTNITNHINVTSFSHSTAAVEMKHHI